MKSAEIKQFFKKHFNIPVRVRTVAVKTPFVQVWIPSTSKNHEPLKYDHAFPATLGKQLLKIVYPNSPTLQAQTWAGNIGAYSLSMNESEWLQLKAIYEPTGVSPL